MTGHAPQLTHLDGFSSHDRERIQHALAYAAKQHAPQRRISGEPYIIHPVAVAQLLIDQFNADAETVMAGLLHDTVEDTGATLSGIEGHFGEAVRFLVDGATNVGENDGAPKILDWHERTAASHAKVERYAAKDSRVLLVKFADRWHNMTSCGAMREKNQVRLAKDTLFFHVPHCRDAGYPSQAHSIELLCKDILAKFGEK